MNTRVFKIFKGHVIASVYIFVSDSILETFPDQTFVFNNIWRNFLRRLRRGRQSKFGRSLGRGGLNRSGRINIKYLGRLMRRRRIRLATWDEPCLVFLLRRLGRFSKSKFLDKVFLLSPVDGRTWGSTFRRAPSLTSFPLFPFMVAIPLKREKNFL